MAEIVLLLTFLILLALAALLLEKERSSQLTKAKLKDAEKLISVIAPGNKPIEFNELVKKLRETQHELKSTQSQLVEKTDRLNEVEKKIEQTKWLEQLKNTLDIEKPEDFSELVKEVREIQKQTESGQERPSYPTLKLQNKRLAENNKQLQNKLRKFGGGAGDPLQCWYNPETHSSEYIFDIALRDNSFVIRDNKLPHRAAEQSRLPLDKIVFGKQLSPEEFMSQTRPLFDWSVKNECRFTVRAFDQVKGSKAIYKKRLNELEGRFYKANRAGEDF